MKKIYFLKYNNYANRKLKIGNSLTDYLGADLSDYIQTIPNCTLWNPNDGITTVINTPTSTDFSVEPDYLIAVDEYNNIDSRWFVIETRRLQSGQYRCILRRDVFAEAWQDLIEADCHIDRAILLNEDPLIFNPEPITVNQILTSERLLKDKTGVPWIVFYSALPISPVTNYNPYKNYYDLKTNDIVQWESDNEFNFLPDDLQSIQIQLNWKKSNNVSGWLPLIPNGGQFGEPAIGTPLDVFSTPFITNPSAIDYEEAIAAFENQFTLKRASDAAEILALDGKILYNELTNKYYSISATASAQSSVQNALGVGSSDTFEWAEDTIQHYTNIGNTTIVPGNIVTQYVYQSVQITLTEISQPTAIDFQVPSNSIKPSDAPYYMWCMPYGKILMTVTDGTTWAVRADPELNYSIATEIANKNSSDNTFDVQILPFCPLPDELIDQDTGNIVVDDTSITDHSTITLHSDSSVIKGFIFACPKCSFTRQIKRDIYQKYAGSKKLSDICEKTRLYSPNYSSSFEFSMARNNGIKGFNVRCTYMPIQPYIRIAPIWSGLYGNEKFDKDPRGLICSGNYSIARLNDPWVAYQEQNKNLEAIFSREIEHMDVQRKYERAGQIAGAVAGTFSGIAGGAVAGSLAGPGAIIGGVIGGVGSAIGGAADVAHAEKLFQESKSYATDLHYLQLGNVQAMPRSLAKTTAFNVDNRYFPIFATYLPTDKEVDLVDEYINVHSMNVDAEGKPKDYIYNRYMRQGHTPTDRGFISGSIIRIETTFDTHFIDELNAEFQKGVYLR